MYTLFPVLAALGENQASDRDEKAEKRLRPSDVWEGHQEASFCL